MLNKPVLYRTMVVIFLLALVTGCASPQPAPDRVATGVAEQKAIAATLTAETGGITSPLQPPPSSITVMSEKPSTIQQRSDSEGTLSLDETRTPIFTNGILPQPGSWRSKDCLLNDSKDERKEIFIQFMVSDNSENAILIYAQFAGYNVWSAAVDNISTNGKLDWMSIKNREEIKKIVKNKLSLSRNGPPPIHDISLKCDGDFISSVMFKGSCETEEGKCNLIAEPEMLGQK